MTIFSIYGIRIVSCCCTFLLILQMIRRLNLEYGNSVSGQGVGLDLLFTFARLNDKKRGF